MLIALIPASKNTQNRVSRCTACGYSQKCNEKQQRNAAVYVDQRLMPCALQLPSGSQRPKIMTKARCISTMYSTLAIKNSAQV